MVQRTPPGRLSDGPSGATLVLGHACGRTRKGRAVTSGRAGWTSWALSRLDLSPDQLADRVLRLADLPGSPEGREVVELYLCALDVSL